jgi:hypothetical protein
MGPSPARLGDKGGDEKREDMLRLMLSLESLASIGPSKEEAVEDVVCEWEERFALWQTQLKDLSKLLNETTSQLEMERARADALEKSFQVCPAFRMDIYTGPNIKI